MRYLLDTSFAIDHLRGEPAAADRLARLLEDGDEALVNEVVVCELVTGAPTPDDPDLMALLELVEFVQPGPDAAISAGRWRQSARRQGRTLSLPDALIAAAADSEGSVVLTRNARDFSLTPVRVESY